MKDVQKKFNKLLQTVSDEEKFTAVLVSLANIENLDELIKIHGAETVFLLACEAVNETYGDDT